MFTFMQLNWIPVLTPVIASH